MGYFINKELRNVRLYVLFRVGFVKKIETDDSVRFIRSGV